MTDIENCCAGADGLAAKDIARGDTSRFARGDSYASSQQPERWSSFALESQGDESLSEASIMEEMWGSMFSKRPEDRDELFKAMTSAAPRYKCVVSFWFAVSAPIVAVLVLTNLVSFFVTSSETRRVLGGSLEAFSNTSQYQTDELSSLLNATTDFEHQDILARIDEQVRALVVELADRAVDGLWNTMRSYNKFGLATDGTKNDSRWQLAFPMWSELSVRNHKRMDIINRVDALFAVFKNGAFTGVSANLATSRDELLWFEGPPHDGHSRLRVWRISQSGVSGRSMGEEPPLSLSDLPFYALQERLAAMNSSGPAVQAWSGFHKLGPLPPMLAWSSPISYCGNYSCFEGALAAGVTIRSVNKWCAHAWFGLRSRLREPSFGFEIGHENSTVFVVNQKSTNHTEDGMLLGWSDNESNISTRIDPDLLAPAINSSLPIVRAAARVLLDLFDNSWSSPKLEKFADSQHGQKKLSFRMNSSRAWLDDCDQPIQVDTDCYHVAVRSVKMDHQSRWLAVLALPAGAWTKRARTAASEVKVKQHAAEVEMQELMNTQQLVSLAAFFGTALFVVMVGLTLGRLLSYDMRQLRKVVKELGHLDFTKESIEFGQLKLGKRSRILDVHELQTAFFRFACSVQIFARFVPERVVRGIVTCNEKALRLHVIRREVTVMFSDVRDFTSIAESLSQRDLLFVLTRYLNMITGIVESFGGVVTEILGDGVLAFWNTPDDVVDHATKGCQAALAQQEALLSLNEDFQSKGLPQLEIRIGLHTGTVLSGNLGSETKMKFGCMGDPVNLASRLEGLCKNYGTGVMCSGATYDSLEPAAGLVCRYIDLVQVKGRKQATRVYSLFGFSSFAHASQASCGAHFVVTPNQWNLIKAYEEALKAWQNANFEEASERTQSLLESWPNDMAVAELRGRLRKYFSENSAASTRMTPEERAAWTGAVVMHEK
eukprot:TRINITY_DN4785_c1_g1_i1.p1 TRINITY_DN4785_c1_g1~~TRINITY_DN4785_c1_g1_i1.p1  ORF type:complete len:956 (-),score=143.85 TRINITY_DN4785_c1_g1_i1:472-3303(-)